MLMNFLCHSLENKLRLQICQFAQRILNKENQIIIACGKMFFCHNALLIILPYPLLLVPLQANIIIRYGNYQIHSEQMATDQLNAAYPRRHRGRLRIGTYRAGH